MRITTKWILMASAIVLLAGCGTRVGGWFHKAPDEATAPAALVDFEPRLSVETLWQRNIGDGERRLGLRMAPTLAGGRVYAADAGGSLFALDAQNGQDIWRNETGLRLSSSPGVGGSLVVASSLDGDVVAYDADGGGERWRARVSSEVVSMPAVGSGLVVVRSIDGRVFGFDAADGNRRWVFERTTPALALRGKSAPLLGQGLVYVGYEDGVVVALRMQDGLRVWEQRVAEPQGRSEIERLGDIGGAMQLGVNEIYAASYGGQVMAIQAQNGQPLWATDLQSYAGLALSGRYLLAGDVDSTLWALDRTNSSSLWRQEALRNRWVTTPAVQAEHVLVGDSEGYVHWFDLPTGAPAARARVGRNPIRGAPQVSLDSIAYILDTHGQLVAYRVSRL
ncbi:outer membrane protein assembly factor BamB [Alkalisalibacterium limincola]|nr:outer membrane protein assembly factor BamB [Alkalisalibacterium limincola]